MRNVKLIICVLLTIQSAFSAENTVPNFSDCESPSNISRVSDHPSKDALEHQEAEEKVTEAIIAASGYFKVLPFKVLFHLTSFLQTTEFNGLAPTCRHLALSVEYVVPQRLADQAHVSPGDLSGIAHPALFQMSCLLQSPSQFGKRAREFFQNEGNIVTFMQLYDIIYSNNPKAQLCKYGHFHRNLPSLQPRIYFLLTQFPDIAKQMLQLDFFWGIVDLSKQDCDLIIGHLKSQDNLKKSLMKPTVASETELDIFHYILSASYGNLESLMILVPAPPKLKLGLVIEICLNLKAMHGKAQESYFYFVRKFLQAFRDNEAHVLEIFSALRTLREFPVVNLLNPQINDEFFSTVKRILSANSLSRNQLDEIQKLSIATLDSKNKFYNSIYPFMRTPYPYSCD